MLINLLFLANLTTDLSIHKERYDFSLNLNWKLLNTSNIKSYSVIQVSVNDTVVNDYHIGKFDA